jgi:hypothetical protein
MNELEGLNMLYGSNPWPKFWTKPWTDSDSYPQGPYSNGGGEADCPRHCDVCGIFLENPLTGEGIRYVSEKLTEHARDGSGNEKVLAKWAKHCNAQLYEPGSVTLEDLQFEYSLEDDEWGACMGWWFAIAGELYTRNETPPRSGSTSRAYAPSTLTTTTPHSSPAPQPRSSSSS